MRSKSKKLGIIILSVAIAAVLVLTFFVNFLALNAFDNILEQALGKTADGTRGDTMGADVQYYKSDFSSAAELYEYEQQVVAEMAMEGATLLKNEKDTLPLAKGTTLSLFSHSSVDLVSGGSGSGSGSFELTKNLKQGLEEAGLKVNETLWAFYSEGEGSGYKRGAGTPDYGVTTDWSINEVPLEKITADKSLTDSFAGTTAMFVLSRTGGEGADLARDMAAYGGKSGQHYLEPDETELEIIDYLNKTFDKVIILVNANNAMELGWVEDYPNVTAVINFPGAGRNGAVGLGYMLTGLDRDGNEISPSGHLVDTFVYDNFSSPAMQNMGDYNYAGSDYYYVQYAEGIYVGYKYYETRYEDSIVNPSAAGEYDYSSTVMYPFGYGLSYTDFTWSNFSMSTPDAEGNITVSVNVKNTGERAGKEVVQIYASVPYTVFDRQNHIEKASVALVGFDKTELLQPGADETVTVKVSLKDLVSYDAYVNKTYILEAGDYYITASTDAHSALNNVLAAKGRQESELSYAGGVEEVVPRSGFVGVYNQAQTDTQTYSVGKDNEKITNRFEYADLEDDGAIYLSRADWTDMDNDALRYGTAPDVASNAEIGGKQWSHALSDELKADLYSRSSRNPAEGTVSKTYSFGEENGVDLIDLRGLDYNDPLWDELLDQMDLDELAKMIDESGYCTPAMDSVNKPKVTDLDGPAGLNSVVNHGSVKIGEDEDGNDILGMTWPSEYLLASTWNVELAYEMGKGIAEDGLYGEVEGWYGPAVNIHRTPFAGRNFEYYSEDSFLSGEFGYQAVNGAAQKGMYAFLKHFALNDQETHRDHRGIVTWAEEQAIREIYLKPFEMVLEDNTVDIEVNVPVKDENGNIIGYEEEREVKTVPAATAIMSSFNRIGPTWAGGNYNLLTEVLRNEWGFNGFVLTDYEVATYMFTDQCLAAGGDAKLKTANVSGNFLFGYSLQGNEEDQGYAREAAHHIFYTVVNSAGMNGFVHGVEYVNGFAYYKFILIAWDVAAAIGVGVMAFFIYKKVRANKKAAQAEENSLADDGNI